MAKLPTVAIIGRPNTGKSTLFNRLVGRRETIVSDTPGTTRDQVAKRVSGDAVDYLLVDTGGMGGGSEDHDLEDDVEAQSRLALSEADCIVFVVNAREPLTASDFAVAETLRKKRRGHVPVLVAVNKCDNPQTVEEILPPFYELGIGDVFIAVSAAHNVGLEELCSMIEERLTEMHFALRRDGGTEGRRGRETPKIAVVGTPNVGKSSLVNSLMSDPDRARSPVLVSDIPGTTRDTRDALIRHEDKEYLFIDTAGLKRRKHTKDDIETFAALRSIRAVEECDICVLVLDGQKPVSRQDKRIASLASEEGKGLIILVNKCDLLTGEERTAVVDHIRHSLLFCRFAPILPVSASTREGVLKVFDLIDMVHRNRSRRIPVKELRSWYQQAVRNQPMEMLARAKHVTQAEELPPTFVVFVKDPKRVTVSSLRFLDKNLRKTFGFEGTPVRWITKAG